jgi:hypothetical protein
LGQLALRYPISLVCGTLNGGYYANRSYTVEYRIPI